MEDKKLPWWRRALNVALEGIRSGFGLFSKPHKEESGNEPETVVAVTAREEIPEVNTPLAEETAEIGTVDETIVAEEDVSLPEPVAESVIAEETASVAEPLVEPVPEGAEEEASPEESIPEQDVMPHEESFTVRMEEQVADSDAERAEPSVESHREELKEEITASPEQVSSEDLSEIEDASEPEEALPVVEEIDGVGIAHSDPIEVFEAVEETPIEPVEDEGSADAEDALEPAETLAHSDAGAALETSAPSFSEALEEALTAPAEAGVQDEQPFEVELAEEHETIAPELEPKPEAPTEIEMTAIGGQEIDEPDVEIAVVEPEEETSGTSEIAEETATILEVPASREPAITDPEENDIPLAQETEVPIEAAVETAVEAPTMEETPVEVAVLLESTPESEAIAFENSGETIEPAVLPESEIELVSETAETPEEAGETVSVEESISEERVSSVELSEPVPEEIAEATPGPPDMVGIESPEEASAAPEPVLQDERSAELAVEHAAEQVAEVIPESIDESMEINEPIPEQPVEPTAADEITPADEVMTTAEAVPNEETVEQSTGPDLQPTVSELIAEEATAELADEAGPTAAATPAAPAKPFIKLESRDNESDLSPFSVVVSQVYDGPLDLLLDLIRKQDIDIYDIPIARITAQFLAYVNQLKATDVDVAGEFIYTASLLIHIKSKMLLPRAPSGGDDAAEDPRRELVERLLEHERFKNAAQMLQQKQMLEAATWTNPGLREFQEDTSAEPEIAADTVDLVRIFRDILERARSRPVINVQEDSVTVGQMIQFLARRLTMEDKPVALRRLLSQTRSERALIAMFLALLELVRLQAILLRQDKLFSEIFIKKHVGFETVMNEGAASVHDDWR